MYLFCMIYLLITGLKIPGYHLIIKLSPWVGVVFKQNTDDKIYVSFFLITKNIFGKNNNKK